MNTRARASLLVVVLGLLAFGTYRAQLQVATEWTVDSFGTSGPAFGASRQLMARLDLGGDRWLRHTSELAPDRTLWWLNAPGLCENETGEAPWRGRDWIEAGGTAVVFLDSRTEDCTSIAGVELPPLVVIEDEVDEVDEEDAEDVDRDAEVAIEVVEILSTDFASVPRSLPIAGLRRFESLDADADADAPWHVVGQLSGAPFFLEAPVGAGRLVVAADSLFLTNRYLDAGDASPATVDLALAYGSPLFDEFEHGHRDSGGVLLYLARSRAAPVFLALSILAGLIVWRGNAVPSRTVPEVEPRVPALEPFVHSMAGVYAATGDAVGILGRYSEITVERARRAFGLPPGTPRHAVIERAARHGLSPAQIEAALETPRSTVGKSLRSRAGMEREMQRLDLLLEKMIS